MDEGQLVERARGGDFDAFEVLVNRTEGKIYGLLLRMVGNPDDARDLLQETYLSAYRNLDRFRGGSAFSTWLYRIATNHALMAFRKKVPDTVPLDELPLPKQEEIRRQGVQDWGVDPKTAVLRNEVRSVLLRAIHSLPPIYRAVVTLRDVEGLSTAQTAEILDTSEGAVKTRLHRARIHLRQTLSPYFEEGSGDEP